jgi:hypothetical protein
LHTNWFELFGFVVVRGALSADECRAIAGEFTDAFHSAFADLASRRTPAWLPGLADATPRSTALAVDDGRLWALSRRLLGTESLPCPPEVAWLNGITPWHYDDPLGLRAVKFLVYVGGPAAGLRLLPMSHRRPHREAVHELVTAAIGPEKAAGNPIELVERDLLPAVPVTLRPGDLAAIDLHLWHCYQVREPRILWSPEYLAWPDEPDRRPDLAEKFRAVAAAGANEDGRRDWPVWRDWLRGPAPDGNRARAIELLTGAGAFAGGMDRY